MVLHKKGIRGMDTVDYCHEMLESVVQTLRLLRDKYTEEYEIAPKGSLICNYNHNRNRFYHARKEEGRYLRKYISPLSDSGRDMLKQLARKEYLRVELMGLEKNIGLLEDALRGYASLDATAAVRSMKRAYRMLDTSWFFFEDGNLMEDTLTKEVIGHLGGFLLEDLGSIPESKILLHKSWAEEQYERNPHPFGDEEIYTSDGTRARSKAEAMIYESLKKYSIPFRFDPLISFIDPDGVPLMFAPDFAFEDGNLEEFYWEFCGMMDNEEYVKRYYAKRGRYEKAGIVPWKNIIYSFARGNDIDMGYIESVIRTQIIPRL